MNTIEQRLRAKAGELGFGFVGIIPAAPSPRLGAYRSWIANEMHGAMGYMARPDRQIRREDLNIIVPGVRSMVCVGLDYFSLKLPEGIANDPSRGRISNYAWGGDYHDVMEPRLKELAAWLSAETATPAQSKIYVDTGAILERSHAELAGFGFTGKNTMLINPRRGSYFFLGELLTTADLQPDPPPPVMPGCGRCTRCLTDCPTDAFPKPFVLDARRCISYLSIELKGAIPRHLRPLMGNWIYGCDVCQEVCPWNRFAQPTTETAFQTAALDHIAPPLLELLTLDDAQFKKRFANSPILRIKRRRLLRNACIAAGNWGSLQAVATLCSLSDDDEPMIRGAAAWALGQIGSDEAQTVLREALVKEADDTVREEIALALAF